MKQKKIKQKKNRTRQNIYNKLSNTAKMEQEKIKEKVQQKQKEEKDRTRQTIFNYLYEIFPTYKDIQIVSRKGLRYYNVLKISRPQSRYVSTSQKQEVHVIGWIIRDYQHITINEVYDYMRNLSIFELGKPKCRKTGIFDRGFEIYYEW